MNISWTRRLAQDTEKTRKNKNDSLSIRLNGSKLADYLSDRYDQGTSLSIYHDQCSEQRLVVPLYGLMVQNHLLESQAAGQF